MSKLDTDTDTLFDQVYKLGWKQKEDLLSFIFGFMQDSPKFIAGVKKGIKIVKDKDKEVK